MEVSFDSSGQLERMVFRKRKPVYMILFQICLNQTLRNNVYSMLVSTFERDNKYNNFFFCRCEYEYEFIERIVRHVTKVVPRYSIFVSFSGKDTRSFTGFLYNAFRRSGYHTVINDGDQGSESTVEDIEESRLSIIVFSENYARSTSCLDELLRILECMEMKNQLVCPHLLQSVTVGFKASEK